MWWFGKFFLRVGGRGAEKPNIAANPGVFFPFFPKTRKPCQQKGWKFLKVKSGSGVKNGFEMMGKCVIKLWATVGEICVKSEIGFVVSRRNEDLFEAGFFSKKLMVLGKKKTTT